MTRNIRLAHASAPTGAWLTGYRRLTLRYERRANHFLASLTRRRHYHLLQETRQIHHARQAMTSRTYLPVSNGYLFGDGGVAHLDHRVMLDPGLAFKSAEA